MLLNVIIIGLLTARQSYGKAQPTLRVSKDVFFENHWSEPFKFQFYCAYGRAKKNRPRHEQKGKKMVKPEWGTKQSCPKCGTRFYDLGNDDPATCIECGNEWHPEPVLKSKQPLPFEEADGKKENDADLADDEDLDVDESENTADGDVDLGGDEDLGVKKADDEREDDT
jgi:uncharacterized protein (TIGR02300 family)